VSDDLHLAGLVQQLDDVVPALDVFERELPGVVRDRCRFDAARHEVPEPEVRQPDRCVVGLPGRAHDRGGFCDDWRARALGVGTIGTSRCDRREAEDKDRHGHQRAAQLHAHIHNLPVR
jgi:hypothetical protein